MYKTNFVCHSFNFIYYAETDEISNDRKLNKFSRRHVAWIFTVTKEKRGGRKNLMRMAVHL